jgi:Potential Monad-binding region of RPAP3
LKGRAEPDPICVAPKGGDTEPLDSRHNEEMPKSVLISIPRSNKSNATLEEKHPTKVQTQATTKSTKATREAPLIQEVSDSQNKFNNSKSTNRNADYSEQRKRIDRLSTKHSSPHLQAQPYSVSPSVSTKISDLSTLEKILRQARPENMHDVHGALFNLEADKLPSIFGQFGLDSTFLSAILDAILFMQTEPLGGITDWVTRSTALLDSLHRCGRFKIAVTFSSPEKIRDVFDAIQTRANVEQAPLVQQVKRFWIE